MAEQSACGGHQHDLAALALRQHLRAGGTRHQPGLGDIGVHDVEKPLGRHVDDLRHVVLARGNHENIDATEPGDGCRDDGRTRRLIAGTQVDGLDFGAQRAAALRHLVEFARLARCEHEARTGGREDFRGQRPERARRTRDDRHLAAYVEKRQGISQSVRAHGFTPGG
jgi:hypothetical protein